MMDLVLWRHADAEDGSDDTARRLTSKGEKQAARIAAWLDERLPRNARMLVSPAARAQQTAHPLPRESKTIELIRPAASAADILKAAGWPRGKGTIVVVGHQPSLGAAAALALTGQALPWHVKKAGVWWISMKD